MVVAARFGSGLAKKVVKVAMVQLMDGSLVWRKREVVVGFMLWSCGDAC